MRFQHIMGLIYFGEYLTQISQPSRPHFLCSKVHLQMFERTLGVTALHEEIGNDTKNAKAVGSIQLCQSLKNWT